MDPDEALVARNRVSAHGPRLRRSGLAENNADPDLEFGTTDFQPLNLSGGLRVSCPRAAPCTVRWTQSPLQMVIGRCELKEESAGGISRQYVVRRVCSP